MNNKKKVYEGILAAVLITILSTLAASAQTTNSRNEINFAGMTIVGNSWLDSVYLGRIGVGIYGKGYGIELGAIAAPWYTGSGAFLDGSLVINPLSDKPISPVIRIGAMTSTVGGFFPLIGGGLRIRATRKFGFRAEYAYLVTTEMGIVTAGAFFNF
jgi:hypothetical protein